MQETLTYRLLEPDDIAEVHRLISHVFHEDIAPYYSPEGVREFLWYVAPEALRARSEGNPFTLLALLEGKIIGIIEMQDHCHLSLLFVDKPYQGQGISKELLRQGLQICLRQRVDVSTVTVHASPNAVGIYEQLGFCQIRTEQVFKGVRYIPMELDLRDCALLNPPSGKP